MSQELKPCPFCGKIPEGVNYRRRYDFDFAIECECGACMSQCEWAGGKGQESSDKTIAQWNTRATDARAAKLAGLLRRCRVQIDADHPIGTLYPYDLIKRIDAALGEGGGV